MASQQIGQAEGKPPSARGAGRRPTDAGTLTPYLFMAPYLVLFLVFVIAPAVYGAWISLHDWDYLLPGKPFVGLRNYTDLFNPASTTSEPFWNSMEATGKFTLYSVPLLVVVPLLVALFLNQKFPGRGFFRAVYFAPYVLGVAVIGILWRFILDPNNGLLNYYLGALGLPANTPWITDLPAGWVSLVGVTVWWTLGFNAVIYLAGLQDIDPALYDAAKVDGANAWQRFVNVTMPGLRPVLLFVIVVTILASANMFGQSYVITQGAPGAETRTAIWHIADTGLRNFNMGAAAAMSFVLALALG
ncbi:MAG: carbohydrate ABC transporter permease, partial [Rubrobacter sp.]